VDDALRLRFEAKYKLWEDRLLDLSARNRLLNFHTTKVSTVPITKPDVNDLFRALVIDETALKFPLYLGKTILSLTDDEEDVSPDLYRVKQGDLESSKSPPDLEKSLYRLAKASQVSKDERGVNTLYAALGTLEWRPLEDAGWQKAPLLLVPVDLQREDRLHPYKLSRFDDEAEVNPTLIYMLRNDFDFALPTLPEELREDSLNSFLNKVEKAVSSQGWRIKRDAWLAQFQFKKLTMYRDLQDHAELAPSNALVAGVAGCGEFGDAPDIGGHDTFDEVKPAQVFTVLDADGSQLDAIFRARAGQDLIIKGPPGTGKSQTITNLIAQFLYEGKKILFVSEKMAALSVVYERLKETGLAPFCLELHSDKAKKAKVLESINAAAKMGRHTLAPNAQIHLEFDSLLALRRELNGYARALHQPVVFGKTAFQIHGELAKLESIPDIAATMNVPMDDLSPEHELALLRQARKLSQMPNMLTNYYDHPWYGCRVLKWSMEQQTAIGAHLARLADVLGVAEALAARLQAQIDVEIPLDLDSLDSFLKLVQVFSESPCPPRSWLNGKPLADLKDRASTLAEAQRRRHQLKETLSRYYSHALFGQDSGDLHESLNPSRLLGALTNRTDKRDVLALNAASLLELLTAAVESIDRISAVSQKLASRLGSPPPETALECRRLAVIAELVGADPQPTERWLEWSSLVGLLDSAREAHEKQARLSELRTLLSQEFLDEFFDLPLEAWNSDFRERFSGFFRFTSADYRRCMKAIRLSRKEASKIAFDDAKERVQWGSEVKVLERWFEEHRAEYSSSLGYHFRGLETDWGITIGHLVTVQSLLDLHGGGPLPQGLKDVLLTGGPDARSTADQGIEITSLDARITDTLTSVDEIVSNAELFGDGSPERWSLNAIRDDLDAAALEAKSYISAKTVLDGLLRPGAVRTPNDQAQDIDQTREAAEIERSIDASRDALVSDFGHFFGGVDTDWERVIEALDWAGRFTDRQRALGLGDPCLDAACVVDRVRIVQQDLAEFADLVQEIGKEREFLVSVMDVATIRPGDASLDTCALDLVVGWLRVRLASLGDLSDWIQFKELRKECRETGLDDFVEQVLKLRLPAETVEHALRKRLLVLQLDKTYDALPVLRSFQWRDHDDLVSRFKKLDKTLMKAYAQMVRVKIAAGQPSLTGPAVGQFGFLRRELAKQRRHAPLRKLFQQCGNIILDITPCLMMGPLSVATFLPQDAVHFDVVIFDEASQVPAEEAIGAILRGKQLIVAGDTKQLPPSRFFERSLGDGTDEYDEGEEETPLESVLEDCAASGMQESPLEWHYRSKHESLIAFSNAEFYGNSLITFPSPNDPPPPGVGVRSIYVPDAIYDRGTGKSQTNRHEAERVAELVAQHFDTWGATRSLGVIALGTKQQAAIEEAIQKLLLDRPDLEEFTKSSGEEPFFIKPLENVQGDERDTIIISIGFGRGPDGTLTMNFGPINHSGGERRLNVAVTRARWELTLVTSIRASDIDETKTQQSGPRILKRYLQFAQDGRLPPDTTSGSAESESPFEEAVYNALILEGLRVDRQVGCSSYRIDMAIKDPNHLGRYLLGVECDGASYHSSAVARDRDRLRQQVLEELGWKIHRIWSTDWIRDPKGCLKRLLYRVEETGGDDEPPSFGDDEPDDDDPPIVNGDGPADLALGLATTVDPYAEAVGEYTETPASRRTRDQFYDGKDSDVLQDVIRVVNYEGPVHHDVVVVRVARMYHLQRIGTAIEQVIGRQISKAAKERTIRKRGEFLWLDGVKTIMPRRCAPGSQLRRVEHVAPEEIEAAVLLVVRMSGGISSEELIPEIARVLGYGRTGSKIDSEARKAVVRLRQAGGLIERGGFLVEEKAQAVRSRSPSRLADDVKTKLPKPRVVQTRLRLVSRTKTPRRTRGNDFDTSLTTGIAVTTPATAADQLSVLIEKLLPRVVDKREKGGALWVIGDKSLSDQLRPLGFKFAANGGKATRNKPAWFLGGRVKSDRQRSSL
jgi:very-short-patch-repair endonuclease